MTSRSKSIFILSSRKNNTLFPAGVSGICCNTEYVSQCAKLWIIISVIILFWKITVARDRRPKTMSEALRAESNGTPFLKQCELIGGMKYWNLEGKYCTSRIPCRWLCVYPLQHEQRQRKQLRFHRQPKPEPRNSRPRLEAGFCTVPQIPKR